MFWVKKTNKKKPNIIPIITILHMGFGYDCIELHLFQIKAEHLLCAVLISSKNIILLNIHVCVLLIKVLPSASSKV